MFKKLKAMIMPKITVLPHETICPDGLVIEDIAQGSNLCEVLLDHGVDIEHACEMSCACTTCHVHLREGFDTVEPASEIEEDLLDMAWDLDQNSRLSCQTIVRDHDLVVEIPKYSINHAKENA